MGYFTTAIAALATNASNLRPAKELPDISVFDVLLPRYVPRIGPVLTDEGKNGNGCSSNKTRVKGRRAPVDYFTVKKDEYGRKQIVAHMPRAGIDNTQEKRAQDKNELQGRQKDEKKPDGSFTVEEDELLKALKAKHMSYKNIAEEMKRTQKQIKTRCHELNIKGGEMTGGGAGKSDERGGGEGGGKKQKTFSVEDDSKLRQMATNGAPWPDIARELKCSVDQLKAHLKEIDPDAATRAENRDGHDHKQDHSKKKKDSKHEHYKSPSSKASDGDNEMRFSMQEWIQLQEDGIFSIYELQLLMDILMADASQTWLAVASRFFDHTGRRVHPDDVREKFEQMGSMGSA